MQKILELKGSDWADGYSVSKYSQLGGIFKVAENFNPFEKTGYFQASDAPTELGTIDRTVYNFRSIPISSNPYFYAFGGSARLWQINSVTGDVTNQSSQITGGGQQGSIVWRDKIIYASTVVNANSIPVASGSEVRVLNGLTSDYHPMTVGPDLNLYIANGRYLARLTNEAGTAGNTLTAFTFEDGMTIRDVKTVGKYVVAIIDNNPGFITDYGGKYRCQIVFWNTYDLNLAQIHEFTDTRLYAIGILDDAIYVFGRDNLYVTNIVTPPKAILPFRNSTIEVYPTSPDAITNWNNALLWTGIPDDDEDTRKVYGYGSLLSGQKKVFFQPFSNDAVSPSNTAFAMTSDGINIFTSVGLGGSSNNKIYKHESSTKNTSTIELSNIPFDVPIQMAYVKVTCGRRLQSGEEITLEIKGQGDELTISESQTFSFANDGEKSSHVFHPLNSNLPIFDSISSFKLTTNGIPVEKVELYGELIENQTQI